MQHFKTQTCKACLTDTEKLGYLTLTAGVQKYWIDRNGVTDMPLVSGRQTRTQANCRALFTARAV